MHSLSTPQRQRLPRCRRSHYPSHLPFHLWRRPRPLLRASSDPCSTCRRVRPWGRAPHPQRQRYLPLVPALPSSGPLGDCLSARLSRFGPQSIILGLLWFDSRMRIIHGFLLRGPLTCVVYSPIIMCIRACTRLYSHRNVLISHFRSEMPLIQNWPMCHPFPSVVRWILKVVVIPFETSAVTTYRYLIVESPL